MTWISNPRAVAEPDMAPTINMAATRGSGVKKRSLGDFRAIPQGAKRHS